MKELGRELSGDTYTPIRNFSTKSGPEFSYTLYWKERTINI